MKVLLTFADGPFRAAQVRNTQTAREVGGFDRILALGPADIDKSFFEKNALTLQAKRGSGFWLWKPHLVHRTLRELTKDDWLFYSDAGAFFIGPINELINFALLHDQSVLLFDVVFPERQYTKRDAFILMDCDSPAFAETNQRLASFSLWQGGEASADLSDAWLRLAEDPRLLTDMPNRLGLPNYPGFIQHRRDQSILSLLSKKRRIPAFRDPSQWGSVQALDYPESDYRQLLVHTRAKTQSIPERLVQPLRTGVRRVRSRWRVDTQHGGWLAR